VRPSNWNADHTIIGLGTAAEKDVGVANGVASLDSGGKVPVSELPAALLGELSYECTWNACTITPRLASSRILVLVSQNGLYKSNTFVNNGLRLRLMRGTNTEALGNIIGYTGTSEEAYLSWSLQWIHAPGSISPITFSTQFRNEISGSLAAVQQGGAHSRITLMEIAS
jgi:hypothetical protein